MRILNTDQMLFQWTHPNWSWLLCCMRKSQWETPLRRGNHWTILGPSGAYLLLKIAISIPRSAMKAPRENEPRGERASRVGRTRPATQNIPMGELGMNLTQPILAPEVRQNEGNPLLICQISEEHSRVNRKWENGKLLNLGRAFSSQQIELKAEAGFESRVQRAPLYLTNTNPSVWARCVWLPPMPPASREEAG